MKRLLKPGAGFIVYRRFEDKIKFLGLKGPDFIRKATNGIWDFPKGQKEPGESDWQCAVRECLEEANILISDLDFHSGPFVLSSCIFFLVETSQDPTVTVNYHSGIKEHEDFRWLDPEESGRDCYPWLSPAVAWARGELGV